MHTRCVHAAARPGPPNKRRLPEAVRSRVPSRCSGLSGLDRAAGAEGSNGGGSPWG